LDVASAATLVEMLADPVPLEFELKRRLFAPKQVDIKVVPTKSGKVGLVFDAKTDTISMNKQTAAKLSSDVRQLVTASSSNPS